MYEFHHMLVTGGAGFIGSNFVKYILKTYPKVRLTNLDKLTYAGSMSNLEDLPNSHNHQFVHGDICNFDLVRNILHTEKIDTVVHFAAESHVDRSISSPLEFLQTNVMGTGVLLDECHRYWQKEKGFSSKQCRFHHVSTDEVYGTLKFADSPFTENHPFMPNSPYSASKAGSDHMVRAFHKTFGLPVTISHCSNNYGPGQHTEKFIPTVISSCFNGTPIPIYGNGTQMRDWIYIQDHIEAIEKVLTLGKSGETYNMGGNSEISNLDLAKIICTKLQSLYPNKPNFEELISFVTDRPGHDWRYAIDNSKIQQELCWSPRYSLELGLKETLAFFCLAQNS